MLLVNDNCRNHLADVIEFAINNKCMDSLQEQLEYLATYSCRIGQDEDGNPIYDMTLAKCVLTPDFAPNSFSFAIYGKPTSDVFSVFEYTFRFNGGLIYSGPGNPADGSGPSFSVSLDCDAASGSKHMWSVHT